jgi:uncharacterized membrane protein
MDQATWILFGVVGVMAVNQLVMRVIALRAHPIMFWSMQAINLVVGGLVIWFGLPGFEVWPVVSYVIGLLFFLRTAQNTQIRTQWLRQQRKDAAAEQRESLRQSLAAAKSAVEESSEQPTDV